jgi:uncharacterized protein (DUF885 family)
MAMRAESEAAITTEIERYMAILTSPYKIGQLKIMATTKHAKWE